MTALPLRPFRPEDLTAVFAFVGLCARESDFTTNLHPGDVCHYMASHYRGEDVSGHYLVWPDGTLEPPIRALIVLYTPRDPAIDVMLHPAVPRDPAVLDALFTEAETRMFAMLDAAEGDADSIGCEALPGAPNSAEMLRARGYTADEPLFVFTRQPLAGAAMPERALAPGFRIRAAAPADADAIGGIFHEAFGGWEPETYRLVMASPAYQRFANPRVVVTDANAIAAVLVFWMDPVSGSGHFEPVACGSAYRRRGLVTALLGAGMAEMQAAGLRWAIVKHEPPGENAAAAALYAAAGFVAERTATDYRLMRPGR
jgi:ribosomal protein S18 acetylase RimI-like enzyme